MNWVLDAKCVREKIDPEVFDSREPTPALLICGGCPVRAECAEFHSQPINVSEYVERFAGWCPDEEDDVVMPSGVKAAGINLGC